MSEVGAVVEGYYAARSAHLLASAWGQIGPLRPQPIRFCIKEQMWNGR